MSPALFDTLLQVALDVARRGEKSRPRIEAPSRIQPFLGFAKVPAKAKQVVFDVLDTDEAFRARVAAATDERTVGRAAMAFLERPAGWAEVVDRLVEASEEPVLADSGDARRLAKKLSVAERAAERAEDEVGELRTLVGQLEAEITDLTAERAKLRDDFAALLAERDQLATQRKRAVSELKTTEGIMSRHIKERKRLESVLESMTAAQLSSTVVGGGVTDEDVRSALETVDGTLANLHAQIDALRVQATPEPVQTARRMPLRVPPGLFDDSVEFAEYLLSVPNMWVLVDGYNVTKEAHPELSLEDQRAWLESRLSALTDSTGAYFGVVYDGADNGSNWSQVASGVRVRFTATGVEADDVIIGEVASLDSTRAVAVVSSDRRVRDGAAVGGANVLHSRQLVACLQ